MILFDTPFTDAIELLGMVDAHDRAQSKFNAGIHGIEIKDDGGVTHSGKTSLRQYSDRISARARGAH